MSITSTEFLLPSTPPPDADPFRYGWRYITRKDANGKDIVVQVPLTLEDVLHPEEGDFIVNTFWHDLIRTYLRDVCLAHFAARTDVVITSDQRVDWGSKYGWIHGPDVGIFSGNQKPWGKTRATIKLKDHKAKIECAIEVTSPTTRQNDFGSKFNEYFLVGVPYYVIVDVPEEEEGTFRLFAYQAGQHGFESIHPDERGRLPLGNTGLWILADGPNLFLEDASGARQPGFSEWKVIAEQERQRADQERQRADQERSARMELEAQLRAMEAELAKLKSSGSTKP